MIRTPFAIAAAAFALAACGQRGGDAPAPAASTAAQTEAAVAEASAATAREMPASFRQCMVCHSTERGVTLTGPTLAGVYGRKAGALPGYSYSAALKASGLTWDAAGLDTFLAAPMSAVPGTRMLYAGVRDPADRMALIAYLKTL